MVGGESYVSRGSIRDYPCSWWGVAKFVANPCGYGVVEGEVYGGADALVYGVYI